MRTAFKCRAYPTPEQTVVLTRTFGCVRLVWNRTLAARQARWQTERTSTSYAETDRALTEMKKQRDLAFLNEVSSVPLQQTLRHQHAAMTAFFTKRARYPRYKSRHGRQSASYTRSAFRTRAGVLTLGRTPGALQFVWSWPDVDLTSLDPTMVTVSRDPDGRWYVTKASTDLVRRHDAIALEDLNVAGMVLNRSLAKAISRTGWGEFRTLLSYKAHRSGRHLAVIDRWYPSSKTCSDCGHLLAHLSLGARHWTCPSCGNRHDRDVNAAKNIAVAAGLVETINACGADVRHDGQPPVQSAVNQEPPPARTGTPGS